MESLSEQIQTIGLMAAHEDALAQLYRLFAETFPARKQFFEELAAEEVDHARAVAGFVEKVRSGRAHVDTERFNAKLILASLDLVRTTQETVRSNATPLVDALAYGVDLENGLLEKRYFQLFKNDTTELKELLRQLAFATKLHRDKLQKAWNEEKGE